MRCLAVIAVTFALLSPAVRAGELGDLQRTLHKWQPRLRMADWNISVRIATRDTFDSLCQSRCVAASVFDPETRMGLIYVLERKGYSDEIKRDLGITNVRADQRNSIVHELLHCVYQNLTEEAAIAVLTGALRP